MSSIQGAIFFVVCSITALLLWVVNVVFVDNALPQVLSQIQADMPNSIIDMSWWGQLFIKFVQLSPLFCIAVGVLGWIALATIFGRRDVYSQY